MDDLTAFITARLDEDEAEVEGPPGWKLEHWTAVKYADKDSGRNWRVDAEPRCVIDGVIREDAQFIARHDPARVLREVAAKRKLIEEVTSRSTSGVAEIYLATVAAVWSDHPDYRPEWAPGGVTDGT